LRVISLELQFSGNRIVSFYMRLSYQEKPICRRKARELVGIAEAESRLDAAVCRDASCWVEARRISEVRWPAEWDHNTLSHLLPQILDASAEAGSWALRNLRAHNPEFKVPYSTSKLSGLERVQEHLEHDNANKMIDVYGISQSAFERLIDELGLQDSKCVAKEEKLAMFLRTMRNSASLRAIQDGPQRAKTTESECIKEVLALLVEKTGFYGRYVRMPSERSPCPPQLQKEGYEEFRGRIGAIDGTHLGIK
jgi:hypothetical protein